MTSKWLKNISSCPHVFPLQPLLENLAKELHSKMHCKPFLKYCFICQEWLTRKDSRVDYPSKLKFFIFLLIFTINFTVNFILLSIIRHIHHELPMNFLEEFQMQMHSPMRIEWEKHRTSLWWVPEFRLGLELVIHLHGRCIFVHVLCTTQG